MKSVSLIIFDLDGTLIDSRIDLVNSVNYTLRKLGLEKKPLEEVMGLVGRGLRKLLSDALDSGENHKLPEAIEIFRRHYHRHLLDNTILYPGVKKTLEYLREKSKCMVVITNKDSPFTRKILRGLKIRNYFHRIIGGEEQVEKKPSPWAINKLLKELKFSPPQSIIVGDSVYDIQAGKNAGIYTCGVTYGLGKIEDIKKEVPHLLINSLEELKDIIP